MATPSASDPSAAPNPPASPGAPPPTWAGTPAPPGSPGWSAAPPKKSRMPLVLAVVVVVVIVVVVLALALAGVIPGLGHSNNSNSGSGTFSQSMSAAQSAANGQGSGYEPIYADGFASSLAVSLPLSVLESALTGGGCTFTAISTIASFTVSASGNISQGNSADWLFFMHNASELLIIVVVAGSATVLGSLSGATCSSNFSAVQPIPSTVVDSPTVALALDQRGGYAFLHAHSPVIATAFILGPISVGGFTEAASWQAGYSACNPGVAGSSGAEITASLNAETGTVTAVSNTTVSCGFSTGAPGGPGGGSGGGTLASDLAMSSPHEQSAGPNYWYNFSINAAAGGLTWGDLFLGVESSGGQYVPITGSVIVLSITGTTVASFSFSSDMWTSGGSVTVNNQQTVSLESSTDLSSQGDSLVVVGVGSVSGAITVLIP